MKERNRIIIETILKKTETVCPGALDLLGIYGSAATGDEYEKSDLDVLMVINDEKGRQLCDCFLIDDIDIGYDLYCTSWEMLEDDAACNHAQLSKLFDSEIIYCRDQEVSEKMNTIRQRGRDFLKSEKRFEKVGALMREAKLEYADACLSDDLSRIRTHAGEVIYCLLNAVMLYHGDYFRLGTKRTFEELERLDLPFDMPEMILKVIHSDEKTGITEALTQMLLTVMNHIQIPGRKAPEEKEMPSAGNLSGAYEEMYSNWRNKMYEAAERNDAFSSFMNMHALQLMLCDIAEDISIKVPGIMERYDSGNLAGNAAVFDEVLSEFRGEYEKAGIDIRHFATIREFAEAYLSHSDS